MSGAVQGARGRLAALGAATALVAGTGIFGLVAATPAGALESAPAPVCGSTSCIVSFTTVGTSEWTVPAGVTGFSAIVEGAQGGSSGLECGASGVEAGGAGGRVNASVPANPGSTVEVSVGAEGGNGAGCTPGAAGGPGGAGDGGAGGSALDGAGGGGGGGASEVTVAGALAVVGGGGGGGASAGSTASGTAGGAGGGTSGDPGTALECGTGGQGPGLGASGSTPGSGGAGIFGDPGAEGGPPPVGDGGDGGAGFSGGGGGGGGGGYSGGGGGAGGLCAGGGGGGSSYVEPTATVFQDSAGGSDNGPNGAVYIAYTEPSPSPAPVTGPVVVAPSFTSAGTTTFDAGEPGSFTLSAAGGPDDITYAMAGAPSWLTLDSATGVLSGTPPTDASGTYPITLFAFNADATGTETFELVVDHAPEILGWDTFGWRAGQARVVEWTLLSTPAASVSLSGSLPAGVTWRAEGDRLVLWGAPWSAGTSSFTFEATSPLGSTSHSVTLVVHP